jgi:hypothetical protein
MSFFHSSRPVPYRTAFLDASRQLCHDYSAYCNILKGPLGHRTPFTQSKLDSLFASAQSSMLKVVRVESESTARQAELIVAFGKNHPPNPTPMTQNASMAQTQIVNDIAILLGGMAIARAEAAAANAEIGRSVSELVAIFDASAVEAVPDTFAIDVPKLQRQSRRERSSDLITEADEDDFIIVGRQREPPTSPPVEFDSLLIDEDTLEATFPSPLSAEADPEPKTESVPLQEPEIEAEPESEVERKQTTEPETEIKTKPESQSEVEVEADVEPESEPERERKPEPDPENEGEPESEPQAKAEPENENEGEPESEPENQAELEPEPEGEPEPEPENEAGLEPEKEDEREPEPEPEPEDEPEHEPEHEPEPEIEPEPEDEPGPEAVGEPEPEPAPDAEPQAEPETEAKHERPSKAEDGGAPADSVIEVSAIANIDTEPITREAVSEASVLVPEEPDDAFWDGLIAAPDPIVTEVDAVERLMQATVEQELKKKELGRVPSPTRHRQGESSQTDDAWTSLQSSLPQKQPERRSRKKAARTPQSPP